MAGFVPDDPGCGRDSVGPTQSKMMLAACLQIMRDKVTHRKEQGPSQPVTATRRWVKSVRGVFIHRPPHHTQTREDRHVVHCAPCYELTETLSVLGCEVGRCAVSPSTCRISQHRCTVLWIPQ